MLIEIRKDIFENSNFDELNFLIRLLSYKGRYSFFVNIRAVKGVSNFEKLSELDKSHIEAQFNKTILESTNPDLIVTQDNDTVAYSLNEAISFLQQPVIIVVENSLNDGHFVRTIVKHFDKTGLLIRHLENNWLKLGNAGGKSNFINFLSGEMESFKSLLKPNNQLLRFFVIADSDKKSPNTSVGKQKLITFLEVNKIPNQYHILEKREMENYLPDETIDSILDNRVFIDAYLRLSPIQKDYFDLEKGFDRNKKFEDLADEIKNLYEDISNVDKKIFRKENLVKKYKNQGQSFKTEFPKLFHHPTVTKKTLLKRCKHHTGNPNELPDLVEKIAKLL
ncbi:MAG: hypothetical protein AB8G86_11120 [Saprospiraceae bacterium]